MIKDLSGSSFLASAKGVFPMWRLGMNSPGSFGILNYQECMGTVHGSLLLRPSYTKKIQPGKHCALLDTVHPLFRELFSVRTLWYAPIGSRKIDPLYLHQWCGGLFFRMSSR